MTSHEILQDLRSRILSGYPVLLLRTYEEERWEEELARLAQELDRGLVVWSEGNGAQPPSGDAAESLLPEQFLRQLAGYPGDHLFLLKDLHPHLSRPLVCRLLRDALPGLVERRQTLLLMSPVDSLPIELVKDISILDLPLPGPEEMREQLRTVLQDSPALQQSIERDGESRLTQAVLGLTLREAGQAYRKLFRDRDEYSDDLLGDLVAEKRRLVQGSRLLEFFDLSEGLADIGGLDGLKEWILQRATAFSAAAREQGIETPKGVLLAGVQGCGKSLSARAIARILGFPLVRLDIGALLESTRGNSEQNLRDVLDLMETIAPAVLWLEEIDKGFAGLTAEARADATLVRMLGRFLTWLQEHTTPVFVVATANDVAGLPPELLRRGRFDDLFFIDLPNFEERRNIFEIHLGKRGWRPDKFDLVELSNATEGYSGAEIEQIVNTAIIEAYAVQGVVTQQALLDAGERSVPLSVTMEDEIFQLREWARGRCRPATLDHRVIEVMEGETRRGEDRSPAQAVVPRWQQLMEHGQLAAGLNEFIRLHDPVNFAKLLLSMGPHLPVQGEFGLAVRSNPKVAIWLRLSRELCDLLVDSINGKRIYLHPATADDYPPVHRPQLPVLTAFPSEPSPRPGWFPTVLRPVPPVEGVFPLRNVVRIKMGKS